MITLDNRKLKKFLVHGQLLKKQKQLLGNGKLANGVSDLIGDQIENCVYAELIKIARNKYKSQKARAKYHKRHPEKKKAYRYKIPEIREVEVEKYCHPLLGKEEYNKFYSSTAWRQLRYLALKNAGGCQCCGAKASDGVQIHVDHIKPRSRYPELELSLDNIQVLCQDCNIGKGDWDNTDWR